MLKGVQNLWRLVSRLQRHVGISSTLMLLSGVGIVVASIDANAQDCRIPINFSVSSGVITPAIGAPFNNKSLACVNWQMNVFASGIASLSMQLETASDLGGNTPGAFSAFAGTVLTGSNPTTTTTQSTTTFSGLYPWLRVNPTAATGSGNVVGIVYGFKATSSSISPAFGTSGVGAYFGTFTPVNLGAFTFLHQNTGHNATQFLNAINISAATGTGVASYDLLCVPISNIATTATTVTAAIQMPVSDANGANFIVGIAVAGAATFENFFLSCGQSYCQLQNRGRCSATTFLSSSCGVFTGSGTAADAFSAPFLWVRFQSDGAGNIAAFWSVDGVHFVNQGSSVADVTAATKACLSYLSADNNWSTSANYVSWQVTTP